MDLFKKIIDNLEGNIEAITFASRGEPTLNSNFSDMLKPILNHQENFVLGSRIKNGILRMRSFKNKKL